LQQLTVKTVQHFRTLQEGGAKPQDKTHATLCDFYQGFFSHNVGATTPKEIQIL